MTRRAVWPPLVRAALAVTVAVVGAGCKQRANPAARGEPAADGGSSSAAAGPRGALAMESAPIARVPDGESGAESAAEGLHDDAACPVASHSDSDTIIDAAAGRYDRGQFEVALACADLAADLVPQAVEAHHLRAAALAALNRYSAAQTAFSMALALDPDDPETLAAAADFHINAIAPKRRETTLLGLQFARRGSDKASSRRSRDRDLRARLALLEAQALNDLGRADEALPRLEDSLRLNPDSVAARYERGVSLFSLCRLDSAYTEFSTVARAAPDDPYTHYHLGLIFERAGRLDEAQEHFQRARKLAPDDFAEPVAVAPAEFQQRVDRIKAALPERLGALLVGVDVQVADIPRIEDLTATDPPFAPTILGMYRGLPVPGERGGAKAPQVARSIILYRNNLVRAARTSEELDRQIRETLLHEIGHLKGLDESELRRRGLE
jgi:tetratricopeptide (TPR) repeat protein